MKRSLLIIAIVSMLVLAACSTFRSAATQGPAATAAPAHLGPGFSCTWRRAGSLRIDATIQRVHKIRCSKPGRWPS